MAMMVSRPSSATFRVSTTRKNGGGLDAESLRRNVVPTSDGSFQTWLSTEIDLEERDQYHCTASMEACSGILTQLWRSLERTWKGRGGRQVEGQYLVGGVSLVHQVAELDVP